MNNLCTKERYKNILVGSKIIAGFTLAEIFITFAVIAVVLALVSPVLLQDVQDMQLKTAYKKAFSVISGAAKSVALENHGNFFMYDPVHRNAFFAKLNVVKTCPYGTDSTNLCWSGDFKTIEPITGCNFFEKVRIFKYNDKVTTLDGMYILFYRDAGSYALTGKLAVDVNGIKGPNEWDKDTFLLSTHTDGTIKPASSCGGVVLAPNSIEYLK